MFCLFVGNFQCILCLVVQSLDKKMMSDDDDDDDITF